FGIADRIDVESRISNPEPAQQGVQHLQQFRIANWPLAPRRRRPNHLRPNLIELPVPPLLWSLPPKLRPNVVQLVQPAVPKFVLDVSSHHTGRIFGAQSEG